MMRILNEYRIDFEKRIQVRSCTYSAFSSIGCAVEHYGSSGDQRRHCALVPMLMAGVIGMLLRSIKRFLQDKSRQSIFIC
jgi:hypothetical protein